MKFPSLPVRAVFFGACLLSSACERQREPSLREARTGLSQGPTDVEELASALGVKPFTADLNLPKPGFVRLIATVTDSKGSRTKQEITTYGTPWRDYRVRIFYFENTQSRKPEKLIFNVSHGDKVAGNRFIEFPSDSLCARITTAPQRPVFYESMIHGLSGPTPHFNVEFTYESSETPYVLPESESGTLLWNHEKNRKESGGSIMPDISRCPGLSSDYRIGPYLETAAALQQLGAKGACKLLEEWAVTKRYDNQVIILCRMLFVAKKGEQLRRPKLGGAQFLGKTDYADWSLEPIMLRDGIPLLVVRSYELGGEPEPAVLYLAYCRDKGEWNPYSFQAMDKRDQVRIVEVLFSQGPWKTALSVEERAFFLHQAD